MTNKEAKEKLYMEWQKFLEDNIDYAGISEAYKTAFKALDQEPCENAISRQAVLDEAFEVDTKEYGRIDVVGVDAIDALPPVTPQQKYEDIAKAFQFGLAFGFGYKYDEMDRVIDEINRLSRRSQRQGIGFTYAIVMLIG